MSAESIAYALGYNLPFLIAAFIGLYFGNKRLKKKEAQEK